MRTVFYASNMQSDLFPHNSRSKFETYIYNQDLSYIPSGDIEVAVKSITVDYDLDVKNCKTLALKTNLSYDTISSYGWDNIVCIFTIQQKGIQQFEFENPTFFPTDQYRLSRATFQIVDIETNQVPDFSIGSPTFIEVVVKNQLKRMKTPFQILLDSSCGESSKRFPSNTNMEFCIQLPKRMEFQKDWMVCLKSIHFTNNFYTLGNCELTLNGVTPGGNTWKITRRLDPQFPCSISLVIKKLNALCSGIIKFTKTKDEKIRIKREASIDANARFYGLYGDNIKIDFSSDMCAILGFEKKDERISLGKNSRAVTSTYKANVFALHPYHFIVCCNLVEESILGGERVKVMKYFPRQISTSSSVDQSFPHNDYVKLNVKNFDRIVIRIADLTGKTIQCNPDIPTRLQLLFVNTNSV